MNTATTRSGASRRHPLIGGWLNIADDVERLSTALDRTPDECRCGHGEAHLSDTCPCCTPQGRTSVVDCTDCVELLDRLQRAVDAMTVDTLRHLPALERLRLVDIKDEPEALQSVESQLMAVKTLFSRIKTGAADFAHACSTARLKTVKQDARELRRMVAHINDALGLKNREETSRVIGA